MKIIDTSVAIDHLRGRHEATDLLSGLVAAGEVIAASELVRFELLAGARATEAGALEAFFTVLKWIPVDEVVVRAAGALSRKHRPAHAGIDTVDYVIAATAVLLDADLLTTNVGHFPMLKGLKAPY